jgi:hypothetical protein
MGMEMNTGKVVADEFGAFEDEVLNAEWIPPSLQALVHGELTKELQRNNIRASEQHDLDVDAFIGMMYRVQA